MTSNELKHEAKKQEWNIAIQECRSSGLSVSEWCRQRGVTTTTYYRWERELLTGVRRNGTPPSTTVTFAELPAPNQVSRNVAERCATLHIGSASLDIYSGCDTEQLKMRNRQISRRIKKHLWLSNRSWARDVHSFGILHSWGALAGKSCSAQASSIWLIAGAFRRTQSK